MTTLRRPVGEHAVVLGGSMAGLFAARVLADSYTKVTVVDRDEPTQAVGVRRSIPQGRHLHALQARGLQIIEELFPGTGDQLVTDGAVRSDVGLNTRWFLDGMRPLQIRAGLRAVAASRPFLERHVVARVEELPNVDFLEQYDILGLTTTADHRRVTGVRVQTGDDEQVLDADLVVDATGRGSRTPVWLEEFGYARVEETRTKIGLGYATRHYRPRTPLPNEETSIAVVASSRSPRGAILTLIEDGRMTVTAYGILGDHPPADPDGFDAFLKSLAVPDIFEAVQDAEPLDDPQTYRYPATLRRHYERLTRFPDGLLVTGDAVCSFNPTYAQGMTVAALGALTLREHLGKGAAPRPVPYFQDYARDVVAGPWETMETNDLSFPGVDGERTLQVRIAHAYTGLVQRAATRDAAVAKAFLRVFGLIDPPTALLRPGTLLRVLRHSRPVL